MQVFIECATSDRVEVQQTMDAEVRLIESGGYPQVYLRWSEDDIWTLWRVASSLLSRTEKYHKSFPGVKP